MSFPATLAALEAEGYKRQYYTRCRGCNAPMEWWKTPAGKMLPMEVMSAPDAPAISHFANCPKAAQFRKAKP